MFLSSDAYRAMAAARPSSWDWRAATILLVSHDWDPARDGAEALAGRRLARALLEAGASVHVVAGRRADREIDHPNYDVSVAPRRPFPRGKLRRATKMIVSTIPESEGQWVPGAVDAAMARLRSLPADTVIYGRSAPGSSNIVGWHLARRTGLPWVAHFSDEWPSPQVLSNGRRWLAPYKPPLFRMWRGRIIRDAGAFTFTNPRQAAVVLGAGGAAALGRAFVVTHLGSDAPVPVSPTRFDVFHIVHTGNFYPPGHSAAALMEGLRIFLDRTPGARGLVRFTQAGWCHGDLPEWCDRLDLGRIVRLEGRLEQRGVYELLGSASLLVAVDYARPDSSTVLSKLPDYMQARRPILAITARSSAMGRLFADDGAGLTAHYGSPREVAERMEEVFHAWRSRQLDALLPKAAAVDSFTRERVLAELAAACETARAAQEGRRQEQGGRFQPSPRAQATT